MTGPMIPLGRVTGSHGLRGALRVRPFSGDPSGLLAARSVRLDLDRKGAPPLVLEASVLSAGGAGGRDAALLLEGVGTAEAALPWRGALVSVRRDELPPPGEGEFYVADLVGCEAVDGEGNPLGTVVEVVPGPGHDWLALRRPGGGEGFVPLVERFVRSVDTAGRRVTVLPPEGW